MPSTVEKLSATRVKLIIELPFSDLKPALDKTYEEISSQMSLPGFRKGKVPASLIDQRFGRGAILSEAINDVLPGAYAEAVREHDLIPLGQPDVEVTKLEDGETVEFTAEVDVRPEFDVPDVSTIAVEVDPIAVSDDDVTERIDMLRQRFATMTDVDREAADDDFVVIDLKGSQNGEPLEDADAHGMTYRLGAGGMLDGLDEALHGMKAGDTKTFSSELVGGGRKGEQADIEVTVNKVQTQELPEVDDEFAQMISEFDTVDEMLADVRDNLERIGRIDQANTARDLVLKRMVELTEFELPEGLMLAEVAARKNQIEQQLAQAGLTVEQYLEETEEEDAEDADAFWAEIEERTVEALRAQIILDKLADSDEIQVNQQDLTEIIMQKAMQNGVTPEQEAQHMMEHNHMAEWVAEIRRGKALGALVNGATITDTDGNAIDLSRLQGDGTIAADDEADEADEADDVDETDADEAAED